MNEINNYIMHYGVKGMKWGVRRYQKPDGTLTKKGIRQKQEAINELNRQNDDEAALENWWKAVTKNDVKELYNGKSADPSWTVKQVLDSQFGQQKVSKLRDAFANDELKPGSDYIVDKKKQIQYTQQGENKKKHIENEAAKEFEPYKQRVQSVVAEERFYDLDDELNRRRKK